MRGDSPNLHPIRQKACLDLGQRVSAGAGGGGWLAAAGCRAVLNETAACTTGVGSPVDCAVADWGDPEIAIRARRNRGAPKEWGSLEATSSLVNSDC